jgi:uncharacterized protein (TIGR03382 family)
LAWTGQDAPSVPANGLVVGSGAGMVSAPWVSSYGVLALGGQTGSSGSTCDASPAYDAWTLSSTQAGPAWTASSLPLTRSFFQPAVDGALQRVGFVDASGKTYVEVTRDGPGNAPAAVFTTTLPSNFPEGSVSSVYDVARNRTVFFGGTRGGVAVAETWEKLPDGTVQQVTTTGTPPAMKQVQLSYDVRAQNILLYGVPGVGQPPVFYTYAPAARKWSALTADPRCGTGTVDSANVEWSPADGALNMLSTDGRSLCRYAQSTGLSGRYATQAFVFSLDRNSSLKSLTVSHTGNSYSDVDCLDLVPFEDSFVYIFNWTSGAWEALGTPVLNGSMFMRSFTPAGDPNQYVRAGKAWVVAFGNASDTTTNRICRIGTKNYNVPASSYVNTDFIQLRATYSHVADTAVTGDGSDCTTVPTGQALVGCNAAGAGALGWGGLSLLLLALSGRRRRP